jgi:hypothetical protein
MAENMSTIETARMAVGYSAIIEVMALTGTLQRELDREGGIGDDIYTVGLSLLRRIDELQHVLLDVLDQQEMPIERMRAIVRCRARG